jgi:hypothetical protein
MQLLQERKLKKGTINEESMQNIILKFLEGMSTGERQFCFLILVLAICGILGGLATFILKLCKRD